MYSNESKIRRVIAAAIATAITMGATTYSGVMCNSMEAARAFKFEIIEGSLDPMTFETVTTPTTTSTTTEAIGTTVTTATPTTSVVTTTTTEGTSETNTTLRTTDVVTSMKATEMTEEASTEAFVETSVETSYTTYIETSSTMDGTSTTPGTTEAPREYVVYKESTKYIHRSTCRWCNDECIEITSTAGFEARACSECKPDMEIVTPYVEPKTSTTIAVTDYEYIILCNLVAGEYGSDWVSTYDKGAVVATVIHRMQEGTRWTNGADATIYNVIAAPYQYDGKYLANEYSSRVTQSCKDAVTYALNNMDAYDYYSNPDGTSVYMINSFYGDGRYNWFRHS